MCPEGAVDKVLMQAIEKALVALQPSASAKFREEARRDLEDAIRLPFLRRGRRA